MGLCSLMRLKPSQRRTCGQGVDQSTILLGGGGGRGEDTKKPKRLGKSLSSLSSRCRTLWPLGVTVSLHWPWASGGWHTATPAIHLSPSHSYYTHIQTLYLLSSFLSVSAEGITVMSSSSPLPVPVIPTSPVMLVMAQGSGMSSFPFQSVWSNRWSKDTFLQLHFKTLICVRKQSLMNDWYMNADSSPMRQKPIVWPKV